MRSLFVLMFLQVLFFSLLPIPTSGAHAVPVASAGGEDEVSLRSVAPTSLVLRLLKSRVGQQLSFFLAKGSDEVVDVGGVQAPASCNNGIQDVFEEGVDCGGVLCPPCGNCTDGIKNGMETGVDCGGPMCPPCPTCTDGIKNGLETGVDCGGPSCPACPSCFDGVKNGAETGVDCGGPDCIACPTCTDGVQNGLETGVDCGGPSCPACPSCNDGVQNGAETGVDCGGPDCIACPTCEDGIQNGSETGVDCGGPDCPVCPTCDDGVKNGDEEAVDCGGSNCIACPTCEDGIQNGSETGVDCGGPDCEVCPPPCNPPTGLFTSDLISNRVQLNWEPVDFAVSYAIQIREASGTTWYNYTSTATQLVIRGTRTGTRYEWRVKTVCERLTANWSSSCFFTGGSPASDECNPPAPTCEDGMQNGAETGTDCGGPDCPACPSCTDGIQNGAETGVDCGGPDCLPCPTCADGVQNGAETGIDCGGPDCTPCPNCEDGVRNGAETGIDCGGPDCSACPCFAPENVYAKNHERNRVELSWDPVEDAQRYNVRLRMVAEGFTGTWYNFISSVPAILIRGTAAGTSYEWQVQTVCGGLSSEWTASCTFVGADPNNNSCPHPGTCEDGIQNGAEEGVDCGGPDCVPCPCGVPTALYAAGSALSPHVVFLSWNEAARASMYIVQVRRVGELRWTDYEIAEQFGTSFTPDLSHSRIGVNYEWRVRAVCGDVAGSWSVICTYTGGNAENTSLCSDVPEDNYTCTDGIQNGYETDIDCGGPDCPACPTCDDGIRNGDEQGVDCGGSFCTDCPPPCDPPYNLFANEFDRFSVRLNWNSSPGALYYRVQVRGIGYGLALQTGTTTDTTVLLGNSVPFGLPVEWWVEAFCPNGTVVRSVSCEFRRITQYSALCDPAPTCTDGIQNGDEEGVDCGGSACLPCPTCEDGIQNGNEEGIDCGGDCAACPTCEDGIQNGNEEGIDCGGDCAACPTCDDGIRNGDEEGVDCGGSNCPDCPACDPPYNLYADRFQTASFRLNWNATPGALYYKVHLRENGWTPYHLERTTTDTTITLGNEVPGLPIRWWVEAYCEGDRVATSVVCEFERNRTWSAYCAPAPSCTDGIQNGDEEGVDCGGSDCKECLPDCFAPYNLKLEEVRGYRAKLSWAAVPGARYYRIYTRFEGFAPIAGTSSKNTYNISVFNRSLNAEWWVEVVCYGGDILRSVTCTFNASNTNNPVCDPEGSGQSLSAIPGFVPATASRITTWPNPASGVLNISLNFPDQDNLVLRLRDIRGVEVKQIALENGVGILREDISMLNKGIYFLTLSNEQVLENVKIIVQ